MMKIRNVLFSGMLCIICICTVAAQTGKVGINTTSPQAMFHVQDSSVLFTGPSGSLPVTPVPPPVVGAGTRMMWYPDKAAFRAGRVTGTHWDMDSIGDYSVAFGIDAKPRGIASFVGGGERNTASGLISFVGGGFNNNASGDHSFIGGGYSNKALNSYTFVGGGFINTVSGVYSFIGGGQSNMASGEASFVSGGEGNTASGSHSFTGAGQNLFSRSYSEAVFGLYNTDYTPASTVGFNGNDRLFVIGNGSSAQSRSNAVTVLKNGNVGIGTSSPFRRLHVSNGSSGAPAQTSAVAVFESSNNTYLNILSKSDEESGILFSLPGNSSHGGIIYNHAALPGSMVFRTNSNITRMTIRETGNIGINTTSPLATFHVLDGSLLVSGTMGATPVAGGGTRLMWVPEKAAFRTGEVTGDYWDDVKIGSWSFVGGGHDNTASGLLSFVGGGTLSTASAHSSFVAGGQLNLASGISSFVSGMQNAALGDGSFVAGGGSINTASGDRSFIGGGQWLLSRSFAEAVFGTFNTDYTPVSATSINANDRLFVIGNGTSNANRSNAVTVLKNGRVGIGTSSPFRRLHVQEGDTDASANGNAIAVFERTGNNYITILADSDAENGILFSLPTHSADGAIIYNNSVTLRGMHFRTGGNLTRLVILADGKVGIGTQSPSHPLHMASGARCTSAGTWTNASDARLKENVTAIRYGLETVKTLRPVSYSIRTTGEQQIGFIAQEVAPLIPEVVSGQEGDPNLGDVMGLNYGNLTAVLVKAIQEQQEIIEKQHVINQEQQEVISSQQSRIMALETEVRKINTQLSSGRTKAN